MSYINGDIFLGVDEDAIRDILTKKPQVFFAKFPCSQDFKNSYVVTRFLTKIAYEMFIYLFLEENKRYLRENYDALVFIRN